MFKFPVLKSSLVLTLVAIAGLVPSAHADGFVCDATHESLRVQVYNRTQPEEGTRNVAVMVFSDPSKPKGERTLMRFDADNDGLTNSGTRYTVIVEPMLVPMVDLAVQGIQLGQLKEVGLSIDFSYHYPIPGDDRVAGVLELYQFNGDELFVDLDCRRYLKGSSL